MEDVVVIIVLAIVGACALWFLFMIVRSLIWKITDVSDNIKDYKERKHNRKSTDNDRYYPYDKSDENFITFFSENFPLITLLIKSAIPCIVVALLLKWFGVDPETIQIVVSSLFTVLFWILFLIPAKKEIKSSLSNFLFGVKGFFNIIFTIVIIAIGIFLFIISMPIQLYFWAWFIKIIITIAVITIIYAMIKNA